MHSDFSNTNCYYNVGLTTDIMFLTGVNFCEIEKYKCEKNLFWAFTSANRKVNYNFIKIYIFIYWEI